MRDQPRAIRTNGEGNVSTYHLNLTRTLAPYIAKDMRRERLIITSNEKRQQILKGHGQ